MEDSYELAHARSIRTPLQLTQEMYSVKIYVGESWLCYMQLLTICPVNSVLFHVLSQFISFHNLPLLHHDLSRIIKASLLF